MSEVFGLLSIGLAFFVVAVSPGPANIANATTAMCYGRKTSVTFALGLTSGLLFWGIIAATGLGTVLQTSVYLLMALKVLGGCYLLWLAWLSIKAVLNPDIDQASNVDKQTSLSSWFVKGLIINISNPKTVIAWMAALSMGMDSQSNVSMLIAGVAVCLLVGLLTNLMYSMLFSVRGVMNSYQKFHRWINGIAAALFALGGVKLTSSAFESVDVSVSQ